MLKSPSGSGCSITLYLRSVLMFLAVRTIDPVDLRRTIDYGHVASVWFDACGVYCYGWNDRKDAYVAKDVRAANIELDRVLSQVCTALRNLP